MPQSRSGMITSRSLTTSSKLILKLFLIVKLLHVLQKGKTILHLIHKNITQYTQDTG